MAMTDEQLTKKERKALKKLQKAETEKQLERRVWLNRVITYGIIAVVVGVVGYFIYNSIVPVPEGEGTKPVDQVLASDWVRGNREAPVVLVEYSDFQCPACRAYEPQLQQLSDEMGEQVALIYRHFPLKQIHLQSELSAQAAEAAGKQGKFWEMHDKLFETQEQWAENPKAKAVMIDLAEELQLNVEQFKQDMGSKEIRGLVKADLLSALSERLNSTPSFFLNGERVTNPNSYEAFRDLVLAQLPATGSAEISE
jgi:protein-disulfide isomerase